MSLYKYGICGLTSGCHLPVPEDPLGASFESSISTPRSPLRYLTLPPFS